MACCVFIVGAYLLMGWRGLKFVSGYFNIMSADSILQKNLIVFCVIDENWSESELLEAMVRKLRK